LSFYSEPMFSWSLLKHSFPLIPDSFSSLSHNNSKLLPSFNPLIFWLHILME
jgi:hypothetical protein